MLTVPFLDLKVHRTRQRLLCGTFGHRSRQELAFLYLLYIFMPHLTTWVAWFVTQTIENFKCIFLEIILAHNLRFLSATDTYMYYHLLHDDVIHQRDRYAGICDTCTAVQYHGSTPPYMVMLMYTQTVIN